MSALSRQFVIKPTSSRGIVSSCDRVRGRLRFSLDNGPRVNLRSIDIIQFGGFYLLAALAERGVDMALAEGATDPMWWSLMLR
jgi:hypothetical protein